LCTGRMKEVWIATIAALGKYVADAAVVTSTGEVATEVEQGGSASMVLHDGIRGVTEVAIANTVSFSVSMADSATYVPSPYEPGWEVWVGAVAGVIPFAIGSFEFGKRIVSESSNGIAWHVLLRAWPLRGCAPD
jgi:hypothetical protein